DGDKTPEILYVARTRPRPNTEAFELRALARDKSGSFRPYKWGDAETAALPEVKAVPAAIQALDVNADDQADLMIFNEYGPPQLLLGGKGEPPRPFSGGLGPLTGAAPSSISRMNLDGPALIVGQNTYARRIVLDAQGHWAIKDQYNSGRNSAFIQ